MGCSKKAIAPVEVHVQIDCHILNSHFLMVKSFPGDYCAFFPNGEWISLTGKVIDLHSKTNQLRLHFPQMGHDEIMLSKNEENIFFLSSEIRQYNGKPTRFDIINKSDRNGKLVARWDLFEHREEVLAKLDLKEPDLSITPERMDEALPEIKYEFAHLNSIYEIPKNDLEKNYPYLAEGNLLVTFNGLGGVVVFDPELKNIQYAYRLVKTNLYGISDGQILSNGHLLIFTNDKYSSIHEFNMQQAKIEWSFNLRGSMTSSSFKLGSVQALSNNNIFISENSNNIGKMLEVSRLGAVKRIQLNDIIDSRTRKPTYIHRAKKINLDKFIENNF